MLKSGSYFMYKWKWQSVQRQNDATEDRTTGQISHIWAATKSKLDWNEVEDTTVLYTLVEE